MQEAPSIHPMWAPRLYANASRINKKKRRRRRNSNAGCGEDSTVTSPPKRHRLITNSHAVAPQIQQGGHGHGDDNTSNCGKPSVMPENHTLQLIIDILQRRDAYEIFAEPVDPNEVEDYYQIIKEPMDFGTMRAKLHEGMYQNLEQFKHDVFLITRNAMHFNSSATIYFRQARAIHELAKRVFHVLETDPENFQVEFSGTRRRSSRRAQSEASRIATDVRPSSVATNVSLQGTPSSVGASIFGKSSRGNSWLATTALHTNKKNYGFISEEMEITEQGPRCFSGARAGQRFNNVEGDRRFTYRPQNYPFGCDNNLVGSKCFDSNPLILGTNYRESLLLFVKDLGPSAHMIAAQKIRQLHEISPIYQRAGSACWGVPTPECQLPSARGTSHQLDAVSITAPPKIIGSLPDCCSVLMTTPEITRNYAKGGDEVHDKKRMGSARGAYPGEETVGCNEGINVIIETGRGKAIQNRRRSEVWLGSCPSGASSGGLNSCMISSNKNNSTAKSTTMFTADAAGGKLDDNVRPVILALEHSHANVSHELKSRNKKSCTASSSTSWVSLSQIKASSTSSHVNNNVATNCTSSLGSCHGATGGLFMQPMQLQALESNNNKYIKGPVGLSPFTFNMGFLKAQLNQMNLEAAAGAGGRDMQGNYHEQQFEIKSPSWTERAPYTSNKELLNCSRPSLVQPKFTTHTYNYELVPDVPTITVNVNSWPSLDALDSQLALKLS